MKNKIGIFTLSVLSSALFAAGVSAADSAGEPGRESGKPNPLKNVYSYRLRVDLDPEWPEYAP